jgi:hypothetical protein
MKAAKMLRLNIAKDYSPTPGSRRKSESVFSGEKLRTEVLVPLVTKAKAEDLNIEINLDGTAGYGTSFLEEAFGGLIRVNNFDYNDLAKRIHFISTEEEYLITDIFQYMKDASDEK